MSDCNQNTLPSLEGKQEHDEEILSKRRVTIQIDEYEGASSQDSENDEELEKMNNEGGRVAPFYRTNANYPLRRKSLIMDNPKKVRPQLLVSVVGTLGYFCTGAIRGWSSCGAPSLNATRTFDVLPSDYPWLSSLPMIGAIAGAILISFPMQSRGRKNALFWEYICYIAGFLMIGFTYFGRHKAMLYVGRVITGVGTGMTTPAAQIYVSECSSPRIKGRLGSLSASSLALGILVTFIFGAFVNWYVLAFLVGLIPIFFMMWTSRMPETPTWYLMHGRKDEARESLKRLRGRETDVEEEMGGIIERLERNKAFCSGEAAEIDQKLNYSELFSLPVLKPLFISFSIMFFRQATGINAVICNTVNIFKWTGITLVKPQYATIIVGIVQFIFTFTSGLICLPNIGRRYLLMASSLFISISTASLGLFFYLKKHGGYEEIFQHLGWLPLVSLILFFAAFSCGYSNIPFIIMGEMFPSKFRGVLGTTSSIANFLFAFVVLRFFMPTVELIGEDGIWFLFAVLTFLSIGFVYFFVPETKGKTVEEMEKHFGFYPTSFASNDDDEIMASVV